MEDFLAFLVGLGIIVLFVLVVVALYLGPYAVIAFLIYKLAKLFAH